MLQAIVFFGLAVSAFASPTLDVLVNAVASFSATIQQQLEMLQSDPSPAEFAEKTIDYAEAKAEYFKALRAEVPAITLARNRILPNEVRLAVAVEVLGNLSW